MAQSKQRRSSILKPDSKTIVVPGFSSFLEASKCFKRGIVQIDGTMVKIDSVDQEFTKRYCAGHVDPVQQDELQLWYLKEGQVRDSNIIAELSGAEKTQTSLSHMLAFMMMLWTDERREIKFPAYKITGFYIKDRYGDLGVVGVSWWGQGLMISAHGLDQPPSLSSGYRFVTTTSALETWLYAKKETRPSVVTEITNLWQAM